MKARRGFVHRLRWSLVIVCTLLLVDQVLRTGFVERPAARLLEAGLEVLTGERVVVGTLDLDPLTQGVQINGLIISHVDDSGHADPIVTVGAISARVGFPWGGGWIRTLEIERPVVSLHIDEDGLREFRNARISTGRTELPWNRIHLANARLDLDTPVGSILLEGLEAETIAGDEVDITVQTARLRAGDLDEVARTVSAQRVRLSPNGVVVPQFEIESEHVEVSGSIDATFGGELKGDLTAGVTLSLLNVLAQEGENFDGLAGITVALSGTVREPKADGKAWVRDFEYKDVRRPEKPRVVKLEWMVADVSWERRRLDLRDAVLDLGDGELELQVQVDLVSQAIQVNGTLVDMDFRKALRQVGGHRNAWTTFQGDGEFVLAGVVNPLRLAGSFALDMSDLDAGSGPPEDPQTKTVLAIPALSLEGAVDISKDGAWVDARQFTAGRTSGSFDAFIGTTTKGPLDLRFKFDPLDLRTIRPLNDLGLYGRGPVSGVLAGPYNGLQLSANGSLRGFELVGLRLADVATIEVKSKDLKTLEFPRFTASLGASKARGQAEIVVSKDPQIEVSVEILEGRIGDLVGVGGSSLDWLNGKVAGMFTMTGDPSKPDGEVALEFRDVDVLGESFPAGSLSGWLDAGTMRVGQLSLDRWNGEEGLLVRGSVERDWTSNLAVTGTGFRLARLNALERNKMPVDGSLSLDVVIQGSLIDPEPAGRIALRNTVFSGHEVPSSTIHFEHGEDGIDLKGTVVGTGLTFTGLVPDNPEVLFEIDADLQAFPLHTVYPVAADGTPVKANLTGTAQFTGFPSSDGPVVDVVGRGRALQVGWDRHTLHSIGPWDFASTGRSMQLSGFRMQGPGTDISWDLSSDKDGVLSGNGGGVADADLARMVVDGLTRADGPVGLDIGVGGTIRTPEWHVKAALLGVTVQGDWFPHPVEGLTGVVDVFPDSTYFRRLDYKARDKDWLERVPLLSDNLAALARHDGIHGTIGGGALTLRGGYKATNWRPEQYEIQAELKGGRVQFIEELPPVKGDAIMTFDGPADDALLSGSIDVAEMVLSERITWEEWMLEFSDDLGSDAVIGDGPAAFSMDISLKSDDTIRVQNNVGDLIAGGEMRVVGDTNQPGLVGSVVAKSGGRMHLKEREFEVARAEIHFVDPYAFDPELDLLLNTTVRSREDEYAVTYRVSGTFEDWRAETRSEPNLPQADVNALLLFGMTRAELERYGGLAGALAVEGGDLLASSVLFTGRDDGERGALFRIVDPLRPERLDLVSGVSERGSGLVTSELRLLYENELTDVGLPGSLMILEQNISRANDTYLGFEQRLARTLYARTYWGSEQVGRFLDVGGAYGLEMKVRWELD